MSERKILAAISTSSSRKWLFGIWLLFVSFALTLNVCEGQLKPPGYRLIEKPDDIKEFRKLLRTKTNVLVLFTAKGEGSPSAKFWVSVLAEAADKAFGKGTIAIVNCGGEDGKKLCKKLKVSPDPVALKHYHNGEYHKDYDRLSTSSSVVNFLLDPSGDPPWEEDSSASHVIHLSDGGSMTKLLKKEKLPVLIMFYAPWCGFCKRFKPDFAAAASDIKGSGILAAMDVNKPENADVQEEFNITGFPTLLYFQDGKYQFHYGGENNREGVVAWMKDPQPPKEKEPEKKWSDEVTDVVHLKDTNFHEFISENPSVLVMFYAPWCGHCKAMKPDYVKAAEELKGAGVSGVLAAVDATEEKAVGAELDIQGFPSLKYFHNGKFAWDFRERTPEKIVEFMKDPKEPPPPPPPEPDWAEAPGDVHHLTGDTFKAELKKKKHALIMFYAPWCGHCKAAKPEFSASATTFKDEGKIMFGAVDCTVVKDVCNDYEVQGFPTIIYFSYLKHSEPYSKGRTQADFESFMREAAGIGAPQDEVKEPPPDPTPKPEEAWDPAVKILTPDTFQDGLSSAGTGRAMVMFFAPWCGHCKRAKPEYSEAAKASPPHTLMAALDCAAHSEFCKEKGVRGFPTFQTYAKGVLEKVYTGERTKDGFLQAFKEEETKEAEEKKEDSKEKDLKTEEPQQPPAKEMEKEKPKPSPAAQTDFGFDGAVKSLSPENFEDSLKDIKSALIMFYAPWCGHCKRAKGSLIKYVTLTGPDFSEAAKSMAEEKQYAFGAVDCTLHRELCQSNGVRGYPTLKLFENGKFSKDYSGGRNKAGFVAGVQGKTPEKPPAPEFLFEESVKVLAADTFDGAVSGVKRSLVMFYAPWCGHCKKAKPDFSAAATALEDDKTKLFGAVDCTLHRDLCSKHGVRGFPTLLLFEDGKLVKKHAGGRSKDDFVKSISQQLEAEGEKEAPAPAPAPEAKPAEDWSPEVKQLTADNFQSSLADVKTALVMFYAPWCGHCKRAKPEFSAAATALQADKSKVLAALDCTEHKELCSERGVKGYPTFQVFENGKFLEGYSGGRSKEAFVSGLSGGKKKTEL